jgi:hypothetical protein
MENIPPTLYIAAGAIVAALISGLLSFINLTITKDQKTSEFRQEWINSLREEVSELIGLLTKMTTSWSFSKKNGKEGPVFILENIDTIKHIDNLIAQIKLRLNPIEHKTYIDSLDKLEGAISCPIKLSDEHTVNELQNELVKDTQQILRDEWLIVKTGEPSYIKIKRYIRNGFRGLLLLLILLVIVA